MSRANEEGKLLIAGLGNPGEKYEGTRHNLGADFVKSFAENEGLSFKKEKYAGGFACTTEIFGKYCVFFIPDSFMNLSGAPLTKALDFYDIDFKSGLLLVHDDMHLPHGSLKFAYDKSDAGHKGVRSVIDSLGSKSFWRLRLGIGEPEGAKDASEYVLERFSLSERDRAPLFFEKFSKALYSFTEKGPLESMNLFND